MKKSFKIEVDCANCANKMEEYANEVDGVKSAVVNFMTLKMIVEFEDSTEWKEVAKLIKAKCEKYVSDTIVHI